MHKTLFTAATTLVLAAAAVSLAVAETVPQSTTLAAVEEAGVVPQKTSDRTPDNRAPHRTPGANIWGAVGVDGAQTPFGTSDRTPENHTRPAIN